MSFLTYTRSDVEQPFIFSFRNILLKDLLLFTMAGVFLHNPEEWCRLFELYIEGYIILQCNCLKISPLGFVMKSYFPLEKIWKKETFLCNFISRNYLNKTCFVLYFQFPLSIFCLLISCVNLRMPLTARRFWS